jgi:uncharacterized repeat protein (TIGR01451 family)
VEITDTLSVPAKVLSVRSSASGIASVKGAAATCTRTLPMSCSLGAIPSGRKVTIKLVVIPKAPGKVRNTATVTALEVDPVTANDVDAVTVFVAKPTLGLVMRADRASIEAGREITYTLRVRNPTELALRHVRTCDTLPAGLVYVSSDARADLSRGRRCWSARRLGAHEAITYRLTARALDGISGRHINRARATSPDAISVRARSTVRVTPRQIEGGGVTG